MAHSVRGYTCGWWVKLCHPSLTRAIPERFRVECRTRKTLCAHGPRGRNAPFYLLISALGLYKLFVCLLNFLTYFLTYLFIFLLIYSFQNSTVPIPAGGRKKRPNLALAFYV